MDSATPPPSLIVLGGPNGAGKSTVAERLLKDELKVLDFVNADIIARGLSAFDPDSVAIEAGRILIRRIRELSHRRTSFALESTLASRTFKNWITSLKSVHGYKFRLIYLWLRSVELSIDRVASRVRLGGHAIPEQTIRRRYIRSVQNLFDLYLPLATTWEIYENSAAVHPECIASGHEHQPPEIRNSTLWNLLRDCHDAGRSESEH